MEWTETAKHLPVGQHTRSDCPQCGEGTGTNAAIINHSHKAYSLYCNACGHNPFEMKGKLTLTELRELDELNKRAEQQARSSTFESLPEDFTKDIPYEGRMWLYKAGLSPKEWGRYGIGYSATLRRVILPVYREAKLMWQQQRAVFEGQRPKYIQPSRPKAGTYFSAGDTTSTERVIVVEDIMSAIRVGKHCTAVSLLGTKLSAGQANALSAYSNVTVWLDGDSAGREGSQSIRRNLGLVTRVENITTVLDPKEYSDEEIKEILNICK